MGERQRERQTDRQSEREDRGVNGVNGNYFSSPPLLRAQRSRVSSSGKHIHSSLRPLRLSD